MSGFVLAWLVGEGIIVYRTVKKYHAPPGPGQLLLSSGVFLLLALLAESEKARPLAITLAWGFDIAAFMRIYSIDEAPAPAIARQKVQWPPDKLPDTVIMPPAPGRESHAEGKLIPRGEWPGGTSDTGGTA